MSKLLPQHWQDLILVIPAFDPEPLKFVPLRALTMGFWAIPEFRSFVTIRFLNLLKLV
jgi:hypothetical protein